MKKEAKARIKINKLLEEAGWRFFDEGKKPANIALELNVKITRKQLDDYGENFDKVVNGFADFLLLDENGKPFIVLEAKSEDKSPLVGKEQAREYAKSLYVKYVILSNGNLHYFWNIEKGNPQVITGFPSYESLRDSKAFTADPYALYNEDIKSDYIACTQMPRYADDPNYIDETKRTAFLDDSGLRFLRNYQIRAVKALQRSVKSGKRRFLFEMATGTGKTLTAAAIIKLFLRTGCARRVLFLVDRIELEDQAQKNFVSYLKNDYRSLIYKKHPEDWRKAEIVVSTVQTLLSNNRYKRVFRPTDFDLIISDESHRSINGNSRAVFEYFLGYKLGLTATPRNYIKNVDAEKLQSTDPRAWERRQLLDTYKTFGCESGEPTFSYSLLDGVNDTDGSYLINPITVDARTQITTQLLSDEGYAVVTDDEDDEENYFARHFERKFFSEETNKIFCMTFMENALHDPISGEIGKSIIFAVSRNHATKIVQILNEFAELTFPGKYNSDFAMQITSEIPNVQTYTVNFQNNNLSGWTNFLDDYKSSKTRVCVTVGMMTTGYDCQDLLNVVLMRPIFSPTDFVQIKGRGTRMHTFSYLQKENGDEEKITFRKENFKLFDFFGNCEYFEEKYDYDEIIKLPRKSSSIGGSDDELPPATVNGEYENLLPDPIKTIHETHIGTEGMKIDRKLYEKFEEKIQKDDYVRRQYEQDNIIDITKYLKDEVFDRPEDYFNMDSLRRSINVDRKVSLREMLDKIFGSIPHFRTRRQVIDDEFEDYCLTNGIDADKYYEIKNFFEAYITNKDVRRTIEDKRFQNLSTNSRFTFNELRALGLDNMKSIVGYIQDNINVNEFMI